MKNKDKVKNDLNINVRVDNILMNRVKKCCIKKWNIPISVFARQALKKFCDLIEAEEE